MDRVAVPFKLERFLLNEQAAVTLRGVIRLEADAIVIEYRETTMSLKTLEDESGEVHEARVFLEDVANVELARNWVGSGKLIIRTRTLAALEGVPGAAGNECVLPVRRRDRTSARELAVATSLALSGLELKRIEDGED